ncbi:MAG: hypothetical protein RMZ42_16665 [Nostoc sp. DedQUE05]|uniref:hypothetical protein n=1 Tax=Nostoc sp. DedQUE05 TaxID=3075391 RepID=UPI002AD3C535|nr:hypothetical protein [Nostoc sp. DedQUE05]MDZ8093542.1 hypothetical protein [Nostoc sp. DedQUE05]
MSILVAIAPASIFAILIFYRIRTNNVSMVLTEEWIATAISTIFTLGSRGGISAVEIFKIVNYK